MDEKCIAFLNFCSATTFWEDVPIIDVNQKNRLGDTPLHTMCAKKLLEAVKVLIKNGAEVNSIGENGFTPLFYACSRNQIEMVHYLLEHGADPSIKNDWGWTAKEYARGASQEIIDLLDKKMGTYVPPVKPNKKKEKGDKYTKKGKKR